jgi:hypothetical protein
MHTESAQRRRILIVGEDSGVTFNRALSQAYQACVEMQLRDLYIVVPVIGRPPSSLLEGLGNDVVHALKAHPVDATPQLRLHLTAPAADSFRFAPIDAALAACATNAELDKLEPIAHLRLLVVQPWTREHVKKWELAHKPEVIGGESRKDSARITDPVVVEALKTAAEVPTKSRPNADDMHMVKWVAYLRKSNGHNVSAPDAEVFALSNGWQPVDATKFGAIFGGPGRKPQGDISYVLADDIYEQWTAKAKQSGASATA